MEFMSFHTQVLNEKRKVLISSSFLRGVDSHVLLAVGKGSVCLARPGSWTTRPVAKRLLERKGLSG